MFVKYYTDEGHPGGYRDYGEILYSEDGYTWHAYSDNIPEGIMFSTITKNKGVYFIVGYDSEYKNYYIYKSTDLENWELIKTVDYSSLPSIIWDGEKYILVVNGNIFISYDGTDWKSIVFYPNSSTHIKMIDSEYYIPAGFYILYSENGIVWEKINKNESNFVNDIFRDVIKLGDKLMAIGSKNLNVFQKRELEKGRIITSYNVNIDDKRLYTFSRWS